MPIELFPMSKTRMEVTHVLISHYAESPSPALPKGRELHRETFLWVSLRGEGTNLLYTMCLILFVFLMCNVEIRVPVFLILLCWSVLIVASHIMRGIWSTG